MSFEIWKPELPGPGVIIWLAPCLALWLWGSGLLAGWLKLRRGAREGDTRKLFHFSVFFLAVLLHDLLGPPGVNLMGIVASVYIGWCLLKGEGNLFYEALARKSDRPRRSLHVLVPFLATAAGGVCSISLFGDYAVFGFAVCGLADALGEPVGTRIGRHRYRSWNLPGCEAAQRSVEGSLAVLTAAFAVSVLVQCTTLNPLQPLPLFTSLLPAAMIAVGSTILEALSPHGTDNFTLQVGGSGIACACANLLPMA